MSLSLSSRSGTRNATAFPSPFTACLFITGYTIDDELDAMTDDTDDKLPFIQVDDDPPRCRIGFDSRSA